MKAMTRQERIAFKIKPYGKSELAMQYFPDSDPHVAFALYRIVAYGWRTMRMVRGGWMSYLCNAFPRERGRSRGMAMATEAADG